MDTCKRKIIIAFPTTTDAMHMHKAAGSLNIPGRMIPLPGKIKAGCGLAWYADFEYKEKIISLTEELKIRTEGIFEQTQ